MTDPGDRNVRRKAQPPKASGTNTGSKVSSRRRTAGQAEGTQVHKRRQDQQRQTRRVKGADAEAMLSAISRGADPSRIVTEAARQRQTAARPARRGTTSASQNRGKKPPLETTVMGSDVGQPVQKSSALRIRNGDTDDLRALADRRLAHQDKFKKKVQAKPKPAATRRCRECLREQPAKAFPSRLAICRGCGGQPRSKSIRTISGGLPTGGRRR